jgi:hypothetical protein
MSSAARSLLVFSVYLAALGLGLTFAPTPILAMFGLPEAGDHWILVVGMLYVGLAVYYAFAALTDLTAFIALTSAMRAAVLIYVTILALVGLVPQRMILLAAIDFLFGCWTFLAWWRDGSRRRPPAGSSFQR